MSSKFTLFWSFFGYKLEKCIWYAWCSECVPVSTFSPPVDFYTFGFLRGKWRTSTFRVYAWFIHMAPGVGPRALLSSVPSAPWPAWRKIGGRWDKAADRFIRLGHLKNACVCVCVCCAATSPCMCSMSQLKSRSDFWLGDLIPWSLSGTGINGT